MSTDSPGASHSGGRRSVGRQIFLSFFIVAACWTAMRFGSLIVTSAITHIWGMDSPLFSAYGLLFRQLIMTFIYPSFLNIFRPAFIPLYNEIKRGEGDAAARHFAQGVMNIGVVLGLAAFTFMWAFPEFTVGVMAPEFDSARKDLSVELMRQMGPGILCLMFATMALIVFHAEKHFAYPHGAEAVQKIAWGVMIFVAGRYLGWEARAIGITYTIAAAAQLAVNIVGMYRVFGWVLRQPGMVVWARRWGPRAFWLVLPLLVGVFGARVRDFLTLRVQSSLDTVNFNSVEVARTLTNLPVAFLGQIINVVMLPHLASILHAEGRDTHRDTLQNTVESLWLLTIPIVAVTFALAPQLVALFFIDANWGPAEMEACMRGALAIQVITLGFTFMMLENILLPGLFSVKSMWWPTMWGLAASGLQILCLVVLANAGLERDSRWFLAAVAFVYPFSRILKNGFLLLVLRRKTGIFPGRSLAGFVIKMAILLLGTLVAAYVGLWLGTRLFGGIRDVTELGRAAYKLRLLLQLIVPGIFATVGFAALAWVAGYKRHVLEVIADIRRRRRQ